MPSVWAVPETEYGIVPNDDYVWESSAVSETELDTVREMGPSRKKPKFRMRNLSTYGADGAPPNESQGLPRNVTKHFLNYVPSETCRSLRLTSKSWSRAVDQTMATSPPAANVAPPEILSQIFYMLSPRDFDNARRTCSQWMRVSLNERLLETMLKRAGWWDSWLQDCQTQRPMKYGEESNVWKMSRRFATECVLSGRKVNVEGPGFLTTAVVNFSELAMEDSEPSRPLYYSFSPGNSSLSGHVSPTSKFYASHCGNYVQVVAGHKIFIYRLNRTPVSSSISVPEAMDKVDITPLASIMCPNEVIAVSMDTSTPKVVVAVLMRDRSGLICDLVPTSASDEPDAEQRTGQETESSGSTTSYKMQQLKLTSPHYYHNVCSADDPPRSVSICPGRRCVAFGSGRGIELHWFDEKRKQDCRKHFPMSQPSEVLHFLRNRPESPTDLRLISSLAGPGGHKCECDKTPPGEKRPICPLHLLADVQSFTRWNPENSGNLSLVRATHCHHYRAIPINDGFHILFIEPRTSLLCIGSDAPIGGPTSLTRALVCVPPFGKDPSDAAKEGLVPTVFASGSDWKWGLRVVAAYSDRIILYSVPLDVFNVIRKERERQGDGVMGDSDLARDWFLDNQRSRKRRESLVQNQNGDWEFLLSVSYRPTAMMWPFKIYGKEIGRMDDVVELALQASHGGARVWAFGASGETHVIDVDTFSSASQSTADIPLRSMTVSADGSLTSVTSARRGELETMSSGTSRKRKQAELRDEFGGQHSLLSRSQQFPGMHGMSLLGDVTASRRTSFAACIVDFKIPELGSREGKWARNEVESV
ncbi:hypothetical protein BJX96DRAFT_12459 [Aspergillus floccosus]